MSTNIKKICNADNISLQFNLKFIDTKVYKVEYNSENSQLIFEYKGFDHIIKDFNKTGLFSTHILLSEPESYFKNNVIDLDFENYSAKLILFLTTFEYENYPEHDTEIATATVNGLEYRPYNGAEKKNREKGSVAHFTIIRKQKDYKATLSILYEKYYFLIEFTNPVDGCFD